MDDIKRNVTKYSGLPLSAVIYLVSTSAPVNELLKREVWKELFYRYFMEGRTFNLYDLLKQKPEMFANTIAWELQRVDVEIPVAHAESFIKDLIEFTEYIDRKVLESGVEFEWQLHELQGMKEMIERVRDAKIQDANTRQKINLFIDKINNARKKSLVLIEQAKAEQARVQSTELAIVPEEKHELMKQELKRLSIPVSKMTIQQWEEAIRQFDTYYPQDQKALIRHGLRKGISFYDHSDLALLAFQMNLELKIPYNMTGLLFKGLLYSNMPTDLFGSDEAFYLAVKEWYFSAEGSTEKGWRLYSQRVLEAMDGEFAKTELINRSLEEMKALYPLIQQYMGAKLSEVFQQTAKGLEQVNYTPKVSFDKEKIQWVTDEFSFREREMTFIEKFYALFNYIRGVEGHHQTGIKMVNYEAEDIPDAEITISKRVPLCYHGMIRDFCQFPSTLVIDENMAELIDNPPTEWLYSYFDPYHDQNELKWWFQHKFNSRMVEKEELEWLFTTKEGLSFFKTYTKFYFGDHSGWLKSQGDYIGRYFDQVLSLFDFTKREERVQFFQLPINAERFFKRGGYLTPDHAQMVASKLQKEAPHEYQIIAEYFSDINLTYEEFVVHPMFGYLSELERLLLEKEGIPTGETQKHQGYKEREITYTPKEAQNKFVIEYFQKLYEGEKI